MNDKCLQPKLLDQIAASDLLKIEFGMVIAPATLQKRRCIGGGPRFSKVMSRALYSPADLRAWATSQIGPPVHSTSEIISGVAA